MKRRRLLLVACLPWFAPGLLAPRTYRDSLPPQRLPQEELDARVRRSLAENRRSWRDMNVPEADGQRLHDLVLEHGYTRALEIGTSTGHSAIWIAWALSKTGGRLITVEIDRRRYEEALRNFQEAGLTSWIDARLADAHQLVPELEGPFDFVFLDADKDWYANSFQAVYPKLQVGGCFTAHNVAGRRTEWVREFLEAVERKPDLETEIVGGRRSGLSVSFRRESATEPPQGHASCGIGLFHPTGVIRAAWKQPRDQLGVAEAPPRPQLHLASNRRDPHASAGVPDRPAPRPPPHGL